MGSMFVASASGVGLTAALYPSLHQRSANPLALGLSGLLCLLWGFSLIAPGLLGWLPNEDARSGKDVLTGWQRVGIVFGGLVAVAVTGAFLALVGESSGGDP